MLVYKGRSSFCEASHDFELKTLSFFFYAQKFPLVASRSKLTCYLDAMRVC